LTSTLGKSGDDAGLARAVSAFFPAAASVETFGEHANLARVTTPEGNWVVRRWPEGTTRERVDFVHAVLRESREAGLEFVPDVAVMPGNRGAAIVIDGRLYDAQSWLPGRTPGRGTELLDERGRAINRPATVSADTQTAAVRAVATWHVATAPMAARQGVPRAPLDAVLRAVRGSWEEHRERLRPLAPRTPHIQRWIRSGEVVLAGAVEALSGVDFLRDRPAVVGHLNLWPAHLLVSRVGGEERITGLIDFADTAASSPLVDLAQLVGHFGGWNTATAEEAIGAYAEIRPLAPEERRLLPAVAGLDLIAATGRLLTFGYANRATAATAGGDAIRSSAATLLLSLEALAPAVQRGDRPEPSRARKWDYGPRPSRPGGRGGQGAKGGKPPVKRGNRRPDSPDSGSRRGDAGS
jgi:Ser/Thr protein kinase RdoA (MazF antagonist)